jgi:hypothetical protein
MLSQLQRARASRRTTTPETISAALKGWNTRDPYEAMDPLDAILLDNWYPTVNGLVVRNGTVSYATGLSPLSLLADDGVTILTDDAGSPFGGSSAVQTLATFSQGSTSKFLAACGGSIFDVSKRRCCWRSDQNRVSQ